MDRALELRLCVVLWTMLGVASCADSAAGPEDGTEANEAAPVVAENGDLRVSAREGETATVSVRSRSFASMDELYRFAIDELGGEAVYDKKGKLRGVRGVSVTSGDVRFRDEDTGEEFDSHDLVSAYLGGAAGTINVSGEAFAVDESRLGQLRSTQLALSSNSEACLGEDCVAGYSWRTNYVVYKSVGSRTTQSRGGYSSVGYTCCNAGTLVTYQGRLQCRVVTEWEPADPENGIYKPIPVAYGYRPTQTCYTTVTRNSLTLGVTALSPSNSPGVPAIRTESNTREIEMSAWAVGLGVDFLGVDDVAGVCGFHSGTRGGSSFTGAGSANDLRCQSNANVFGSAAALGTSSGAASSTQ